MLKKTETNGFDGQTVRLIRHTVNSLITNHFNITNRPLSHDRKTVRLHIGFIFIIPLYTENSLKGSRRPSVIHAGGIHSL